ncbi:MAG TPA: ferrochelatase, partial [Chloroflexota bacterium]
MRVGVLLLTFGTADTGADVPAYLAHVRGGPVSPELIAEFQRRLECIGGSPLTRITHEQADCLQRTLNESAKEVSYSVRAGMLHAPPFIRDVL